MRTFCVCLLPLTAGVMTPAWSQTHPPLLRYQLNIARQPLAAALREFARETGLQMARLTQADESAETIQPVVGTFTAAEALERLLAGTSLRYQFINDHTVAILKVVSPEGGQPAQPPNSEASNRGLSTMIRPKWLAGIAALFTACSLATHPHSACAQEADSRGVAPEQPVADGRVLEEVTVTATRREETINRVPVSVTAFSSQTLDNLGIVNVDDVARLTPGVTFSRGGYADTTDIAIRGIDSTVGTATTGVYIDDTPVQVRSLGFAATNLYPANFDLERVEVLRGPQGTLFGAGSEGGTVRFITTQPSLSTYSGYARADYGFTDGGADSRELGAAFGGPIISDKLGFRVSAWARHEGGYIDRVSPETGSLLQKDANSQNDYAARVALALAPTDAFKATLSSYYQQTRKNGTNAYFDRLSNPNDGVFEAADPLGSPTLDRYALTSLTIQAKLGSAFTLTSVTSDLFRRDDPTQDYSHFMPTLLFGPTIWDSSLTLPLLPQYTLSSAFVNKQNNFTEEIRLQTANPDARLSGTVGLFFTDARQRSTQTILDPMLPQLTQAYFGATVPEVFGAPMLSPTVSYISDDVGRDKQQAIFGEFSYEVLRGLRATAGLRYAIARFDYTNFQAGPWAATTGSGAVGSEREHPVTPKFGLSYQMDDHDMFYATVAKGFRIGGANRPIPITSAACQGDLSALGLVNAPSSYGSDHVWSYEIGAKNGALDGRLQINSSLYFIKWTDIQQSVYLSHCGFSYVGNLGSGISKGGDIQIQALLARDLSATLAVAYTDAYYNQNILGGLGANGERSIIAADGDALPSIPWSAMFTGEYRFRLPGNLSSFARFTYSYDSHLNRPLPTQDPLTQGYDPDSINAPATHIASVRAGTLFDGLEVSLYADNVFNSHPLLTRYNDILGSRLLYDTTLVRTYGIRATYRY